MKPAEEKRALSSVREARRNLIELEDELLEALARDDQPAERFGVIGGAALSDPVHRTAKQVCEAIEDCAAAARTARVRARVLCLARRK